MSYARDPLDTDFGPEDFVPNFTTMTVTDDTPVTCLCGARTHEPDHDRWREASDGWWCRFCWIEATA